MNPLDTKVAVRVATLLKFRWGATNVRRLARYTNDIVVSGDTYYANPSIEVDYGQQNGGSADTQTEITLLKTVEPICWTIGQRFFPISILIYECDPSDIAATLRVRFRGVLERTIANVNGRPTLAKAVVSSLKKYLQARPGIVIQPWCPNTLGDHACKINLNGSDPVAGGTYRSTVTVASISGNVVTLTGAPSRPATYWLRGSLSVDGYDIMIRSQISSSVVELIRPPPAQWSGQTAILTKGCVKTSDACDAEFDNLENFNGIGKAMPNYDPRYEKGGA